MPKKILVLSVACLILAGGLAFSQAKIPDKTITFGCNMVTRSLDPIKLIAWAIHRRV